MNGLPISGAPVAGAASPAAGEVRDASAIAERTARLAEDRRTGRATRP